MFFQTNSIFLILACCLMAFAKPAIRYTRWVVEQNSTLSVEGSSNVNRFTCNISVNAEKDTIVFVNDTLKAVSLKGNIQMDVTGFNCHTKLITRDLRKTLKSEEYPLMFIRFISLRTMPQLQGDREMIQGLVEVTLAGVSKRFELNYSFSRSVSGMVLNGGRSFRFSDFKLSPPRKLAGLIRIRDEFAVNFQLVLRAV